jgi:UDP-hydrolysing UDP-N-acetyl-D-glucosamine 2-epimerase
MRTIGVITTARSDYGIFQPVLRKIQSEPDLHLCLLVTGMHLSPEFGLTVRRIEEDGFPIAETVEMLLSSDTPVAIAKAMGIGLLGMAQVYQRFHPNLLLTLGDRFEMFAAVAAAVPFAIPIGHIHGGELTEGVMDDSLRHAITKMSHLHFVSTPEYGQRVIQMGEEPWRVTVSGAPALDHLVAFEPLLRGELEDVIAMPIQPAPLLVTYHPVSPELQSTAQRVDELLAALEAADRPVVFTYPNADPEGRQIITAIHHFIQGRPRAKAVVNLGTRAYFTLMQHAAAMVGNSSSGIIEAPSFQLPVVNIGSRQRGRLQARNVVNVDEHRQAILEGIRLATSPGFRQSLCGMQNPYGDGHAAERIVERLRTVTLDRSLVAKRFHNLGTIPNLRT